GFRGVRAPGACATLAPVSPASRYRMSGAGPVAAAWAAESRRHGPLPLERVVERALYDGDGGFYESGGRAGGRRGDFLTSPEVGPLFGAVVARALDGWGLVVGAPAPPVG